MVEDCVRVHAGWRHVEAGFDGSEGFRRLFEIRVQHGNYAVLIDHYDSGDALGGGGVHALQRCAMCRRAQDPRVEHAGHANVASIFRLAGHLRECVQTLDRFAAQGEVGDGVQGRLSGQVAFDPLALRQLPESHALVPVFSEKDNAICHV